MTPPSRITGIATVVTDRIHFASKGNADMVNLTADVRRIVSGVGTQPRCRYCVRSRERPGPSPHSSSSPG